MTVLELLEKIKKNMRCLPHNEKEQIKKKAREIIERIITKAYQKREQMEQMQEKIPSSRVTEDGSIIITI